jgi:hypothetical protein
MGGKLMFVAGAAIGYVIGTRQGRAAYDKLAKQARGLWEDPRVQKGVSQAQKFAKEKVPVVGEMASEAVDKLKPEQGGSSGSSSAGGGSSSGGSSSGGSSNGGSSGPKPSTASGSSPATQPS